MSKDLQNAGSRRVRRGNGAPTIADVAREAQCSPMTVSRVINREDNVREATRVKVEAAIAKLNYLPNRAARSLAGGEQIRIALLLTSPFTSNHSEFLIGALEEAAQQDLQIVVQGCKSADEAARLMQSLVKSGTRGFILPAPLSEEKGFRKLIAELGTVAIAVGSDKANGLHTAVLIDDYRAAFDMTKFSIGQGHKRIAFITGNPKHVATEHRLKGYLDAMRAAELAIDERLIAQGEGDYRSGLECAEELLSIEPRPTAIFASNDDMAAAAIAAAHRRQLDVPKDISVYGFDDMEIARSIWPGLTTIRQPIRQMATWAVKAATQIIKGLRPDDQNQVEQKYLPYTLVRRASDAPPLTLPQSPKPER